MSGFVIFVVMPHQRVPRRFEAELDWTFTQHIIGSSFLIWGLVALAVLGVLAPRLPADVERSDTRVRQISAIH